MNFGEKLELLMNMTNTTNNEIASRLDIDPSLVSRFRTGKRVPSAASGYREQIASFIASKATEDYQKAALMELTDTIWDENEDECEFLTSIITSYLEDSSFITQREISHFLSTVGSYSKIPGHPVPVEQPETVSGEVIAHELYKGHDGLRAAVITFLSTALQMQGHVTLRLFSEEEISWITEDLTFARLWTNLLTACIHKGIRIEIIHTLQRSSTELNTALARWFPFYLSGMITSYYMPIRYEKIFEHTIFLMNDTHAVYSHSPSNQDREDRVYYSVSNPESLSNLLSSFRSLKREAKPLIRPYREPTVESYFEAVSASFDSKGDDALGLESLFSLSMNETLLEKILTRCEVENTVIEHAVRMQKEVNAKVSSYLQDRNLTLITTLPRITEVLKGKKDCILPLLGRDLKITYLPGEFKEHLEYIIAMLNKHARLNIFIIPHQRFPFGVQTLCIDHDSLLVLKQTRPTLMFSSEQKELVTSMRNYIADTASSIPKRHRKKEYVIYRFNQYISKIERGLRS
ncbi:MAG: hypothetical protein PQJ47_04990 [Sphaerochaetaceae bacterium]|nr:hypothetical protein [Sphaerochaetaceae bacterium]